MVEIGRRYGEMEIRIHEAVATEEARHAVSGLESISRLLKTEMEKADCCEWKSSTGGMAPNLETEVRVICHLKIEH
jgi:hypothetical protein